MNTDTTTTTAPDVHPADRLYRVNDDPDTDTTLGAMIEANEGAPLPARDMARLRALATGERLTVAMHNGPRLTFERRA